jgi:Spy/CpxP family protein refolding chaperone
MSLLCGAPSHFLHATAAAVIAAAPTVNRGALRQKGGATLTYACRLTRQQQQQVQSVEQQQQVQVQADVPPITEVRLHQLVGRGKGGPGEGYSIVVRFCTTLCKNATASDAL